VLALSGIAVVLWWVPPRAAQQNAAARPPVRGVAPRRLLRLNFGVFVLHAVQLAMWVAVPAMLVQAGLAKGHHWQVYLPAVVLSFVVMGGAAVALERRGACAAVLASIGLVLLVQVGWAAVASGPCPRCGLLSAAAVRVLLRLQRAGGQPAQPGLAHGARACARRGLGVYNTLQSLGFLRAAVPVAGWPSTWARRACLPRVPMTAVAAGGLAHACTAHARHADETLAASPGDLDIIESLEKFPTWHPSTKSSSSATVAATPKSVTCRRARPWPT
jgi:hypothetical protein